MLHSCPQRLCIFLYCWELFQFQLFVNDVYGHGLGGDVAPPIDFGGIQLLLVLN